MGGYLLLRYVPRPLFQFAQSPAKLFKFGAHLWKASPERVQSLVLVERARRNAPHHRSRSNDLAGQDASFRTDDGTALNARVIAHADLTADDAIILDHGTA